ncbi:hybrid sensor histidine kinase/response regulator [Bacteroides heparinolyticus]|uniref:hybrid sensor histidine kinase/response regulator n=1 Tax=Prevotella heparinolytica TaxID=28113 RepID=UPI0035A16DEE
MKGVSKVKIAVGYSLLLAVLFFSLFFVHREMESLVLSDSLDVQWTDSVLTLIHEKDANTLSMLRTLSEANGNAVSADEIEDVITRHDTEMTRQRVQHRIITHRDTTVVRPRKKGFFRRLGEVFVPSKKDTAIQVRTSLEFATDTLIDPYNPADSLHKKLRAVARQRRQVANLVQQRKRNLQQLDHMLTERIDSLLKNYEQETLQRGRAEAEYRQAVRHRSVRTLAGIAAGAVLLAIVFLFLIGRDVTRSNRYRRELEEARRRAEDLLATREKLMLAITHDFKAPLGSIMGYADLLARLTVDERQRFYLDNMKTSSEHLLKLIVDLLDFHRLDLHKVEVSRVTFQPSRLLEEVRVSFEPLAAAKGLALRCNIAPELEGSFVCDPLRLRQIINNLLSNAVKFTDRGSVTLTAGYEDGKLVVAITDTGKGMEPADRERIFREFTRLPGAQGKEGFGLGLSIVRMLVQLLEGTIEVESSPGKGSTFTVRVPIYRVSPHKEPSAEHEEPLHGIEEPSDSSAFPSPPPLKKLLLIDDDRIQLTLTEAMLNSNGICSVSCLQPDELFDALRTDTFDLLLTDVQMPAVSGFDLLRLLRASNIPQAKTIPVVAVTARSDMKREEFISQGFTGCLHKPFTMQELLCELRGEQSAVSVPANANETDNRSASSSAYNFSALTAFAEDDPEAAKAIIASFVTETRTNAERLRKASEMQNMEEVAAVSHKMIPVFTLIGAVELVPLLKEMEMSRNLPFSKEAGKKIQKALSLIEAVAEEIARTS